MSRRRKAMERAMRRRSGMSPEASERMHAVIDQAEDWRGRGSWCGLELIGAMGAVQAHAAACPKRPEEAA